MPRSRFVESRRLRPLLLYCTIAVLALLVLDAALGALGGSGARQAVVFAWMLLFPLGGWLVWRRG